MATMEVILKAVDQATKVINDVGKSGKDLANQFEQAGKQMTSTGKSMSLGITAPLLAVGTASVTTLARFDDSMAKVQALSGSTGESLEQLRDMAKELGATTRYSASQAADAMSYLALAGYNTNEILSATPQILSLASASSMDLATASDIVSDTMNAFQMEATRAGEASDILAKTTSSSNTNVLQLGEAMKLASANANSANMDLAQTSAILGILADSGIKGSRAGTTFNAMLRDLRDSAEDGTVTIGNMDFALYNVDGTMRDLGSVMADIEQATKNMTTAQRDSVLGDIFKEQSIRGVNVLLASGTEAYQNLESQIYDSTGASKEMASIMEDTLGGAFRELKSQTEGVLISLGEELEPLVRNALIPALSNLGEKASETIKWFGELSESNQKTILTLTGLLIATGPVLIILGKMSLGVSALISMFTKLGPAVVAGGAKLVGLASSSTIATTAIAGLAKVIGLLTGPIGIAIGALGLLTASFIKSRRDAERELEAHIQLAQQKYEEQKNSAIANLNEVRQAEKTAHQQRLSDLDSEYSQKANLAEQSYNKEMEYLNERISNLEDNKNDAIDKIREEYGVLEETQQSKMDLMREASDNAIASLEAEANRARELHSERITQLDDEYQARIRLLDDETRQAIEAIEKEIQAVQDAYDKEKREAMLSAEANEITEQRKRVSNAETLEEKEREQSRLDNLLQRQSERIRREEVEETKKALKEQIEAVRTNAEEKKEELQGELEEKKQVEEDMLTATLSNIENEKVLLDKALEEALIRIDEERKEKEKAELGKYESTKNSLENQKLAIQNKLDSYKSSLNEELEEKKRIEELKFKEAEHWLKREEALIKRTYENLAEEETIKQRELANLPLAKGVQRGTELVGSVNQYAQGTPFVPTDQLAYLHRGEAVIPAEYNPYNNQKSIGLSNTQSSVNTRAGNTIVLERGLFEGAIIFDNYSLDMLMDRVVNRLEQVGVN